MHVIYVLYVIYACYIFLSSFCAWGDAVLAGEANLMDPEQWFFFCPRPSQQPGSNSKRPRRSSSAKLGFWKVTGNKSWVFSSDNKVIGEKRTLAFYEGYATNSSCTVWRMSMYDAPVRVFSLYFIYS